MSVTIRNIISIQQNKRMFNIAQKCKCSQSFAEKLQCVCVDVSLMTHAILYDVAVVLAASCKKVPTVQVKALEPTFALIMQRALQVAKNEYQCD